MIVFFDTNVLVSAVATRGICADILTAAVAHHQLAVGATVLSELRRTLSARLRLPAATVDEMESFLRRHAEIIPVQEEVARLALDKGDCMVLAQAISCGADALVTGDQALLALSGSVPVRILSPRGFWELLRAS
ncbi:MAG: putative toxin-antitoxin system toxin component, PIN family [Gammaproteobacteria bacterium]